MRETVRQRGFTLLEIMLVMAIIALMASAVMFTLPRQTDDDEAAQNWAVTLQQQLRYAREFAMVRQQLVGLRINSGEYQFMQWQQAPTEQQQQQSRGRQQQNPQSQQQQGGSWQALSQKGLAKQQWQLPLAVTLERSELQLLEQDEALNASLFDSDQDQQEQLQTPQIFILPDGDMSVFQLRVANTDSPDDGVWVSSGDGWNVDISQQAPELNP
ncbi:type II secretion system protein GspH [Idiomarina tyrosinivorans]|uniref:Type II secretion system protein H n=1 Tax=Idiomarina tyrosinivorans TaxID=1445662 RepID=A0A432ZQX3_9GAMM|nr:type II secretion system minor pseudopilin GspH [Idiomarina tyrosinivorans]RUO80297.1 type II secretion system protein GspH [Idiomarina tyrosinivorans]